MPTERRFNMGQYQPARRAHVKSSFFWPLNSEGILTIYVTPYHLIGLTSVPEDIPSSAVELHLQGNRIDILNENQFAHLPNLK